MISLQESSLPSYSSLSLQRTVASLLLAAYILLLTGCGNSAPDFTTGELGTGAADLSGRLFLGREIPNVPISVLDSQGNVLRSGQTSPSGNFLIPGFEGPSDFRVVATVGQDLSFATEVRGYQGEGRYVVINVPTTLVSRYLQAKPGTDLSTAESAIRRLLAFPDDRSLEYGVEEAVRMPFSHLAFFHAAAKNGGLDSYIGGLLASTDAPAQLPEQAEPGFRLTRRLAGRSLADIDARVRPYFEEFLSRRTTRFDLVSEHANPGPGMGVLLDGSAPETPVGAVQGRLSEVRASVLTSIAKYTAEAIGTQTQKQLVSDGWTHIADALNLNYGTTRQLELIQDQLNEVLGMLADLSQAILELELETATDALNDDIATISTLTEQLTNANGGPDSIGGTPGVEPGNTSAGQILDRPETPYTKPAEVVELLNSLATFATVVSLDDIQDEMLGTGGAFNVLTQNRTNIYADLGSTPTAVMGNAPIRSKLITDKLVSTSEYYSQIQQNACTVIGELAHVTNPNPLSDMISAALTTRATGISLKEQRGQLPQYLMSDEVIVDLEGGLMWYRQVQDAANFSTADNNADKFKLDVGYGVNYSDWRVATDTEVQFLHDRGRTVDDSQRDGSVAFDPDEDNSGFAAQGLAALGFTNLSVFDEDGDVWSKAFFYDSTNGWFNRGLNLYFNHSDITPSEFDQADATEEFPYFLVRNIGEPVLVEDSGAPAGNYPNGYVWTAPVAMEFSTLGTMTTIGSVSVVDGKAGATLAFDINTGGSVSMSGNGETASYDLVSRRYTHLVDTYPGYFNNFSGPVNLDELVYYVPGTGDLTVGWEGDLFWHNDQPNRSSNVPVTGYVMSTSGQLLSSDSTFNINPIPVRTLNEVQIWPRNKQYDTTLNTVITDNYYCLAYYSDNTVTDVTGTATWSVTDQFGNPTTAANIGTVSTGGTEVVFNSQDLEAEGQVQITASFGGQTDGSSAGIFDDSLPSITGIFPNAGPASGGTAIVLSGTDFLGATQVTVGGVSALFIVNTDFQITIDAPPGTAGNTAQVIVTNANGPSQPAFYRYE